MRYAFFQGCNIPARMVQYGSSLQAVFHSLGVELQEIQEFGCCGYPMRNINEKGYLLPSVYNMALAEKHGLDICVACNCCFQTLSKARKVMAEDPKTKEEFNEILKRDDLCYTGKSEVKHYLQVLAEDVGWQAVEAKLRFGFDGLKIALLHGCHLLRPREVTGFDHSFAPRAAKELMSLVNVELPFYRSELECCGASLAGINDPLSRDLLQEKIDDAVTAGADCIVPFCTYCFLQLDGKQEGEKVPLPVVLPTQILGLCLGIENDQLQLNLHQTVGGAMEQKLHSCLVERSEKRAKGKKR